jgi:ATP synthase protein I
MATDFTAAVIVGAGLGWGIDALTGWSPWALVTCLLLGFVTGVRNVVRAAMETSRAAADGTAEAEGRGRSAPGEDQGG